MTTTKIQLINRVLVNAHERTILASTQPLGNVVSDCINEALIEVSTSSQWTDLRRTTVATSWSTNVATLSASEVYKVSEVKTKIGDAYYPCPFLTKEVFDAQATSSFTGNAGYFVQYWTYETSQTIKCNPYPSDTDAKATVYFVYQIIPEQPATDATAYTLSERFLKLVEMKASSVFCFKHLSDVKSYQVYQAEYERLRLRLLTSDVGVPPQGYNMYRGNRRHY
jgi:hypothetical protein